MDIMNKLFGVDIKASVIVVLEFKTPIPLQLLKLTFSRWRPLLVILSQSNPMIEKSHLPTHKDSLNIIRKKTNPAQVYFSLHFQ